MVTEDQEIEGAEEEDDEQEQDQFHKRRRVTQSPGAYSNMSGTTALTSYSQQELAELDSEMIVETLPDLSNTAFQLLELLAPPKATQSDIGSILKELQIPGSMLGRKLNVKEQAFDSYRTVFGSDLFINVSYIMRKLFKEHKSSRGDPEAVLRGANIATLIKTFLVAQPDSLDTMPKLQRLDDMFPIPFLGDYRDQAEVRNISAMDQAFQMALEIRTQTIISALKSQQSDAGYDPDLLLAQIFFEPPAEQDASWPAYDSLVQNGRLRKIAGLSTDFITQDAMNKYTVLVRERVGSIREFFQLDPDAIDDGDYVDWDGLNENFSWTEFLTRLVNWSQQRTDDIRASITRQGGIQNIRKQVADAVNELDNPIELNYELPSAPSIAGGERRLQPAAEIVPAKKIIPASSGQR
jgi:hypothetical protein